MTTFEWPAILKRNVEVCRLARAMFETDSALTGAEEAFEQQPYAIRNRFIVMADDFLLGLERRRSFHRIGGPKHD